MWCKELQRCPCGIPLEPSETALEHPSVQSLVGSRDANLLQAAEQIYKGEYMVASSIFACTQCNDLMKQLQRELSECLIQAGLQGERGWPKCPLGARGAPKVQKKRIKPLRQGIRADTPGQGGEEPILGEGVG